MAEQVDDLAEDDAGDLLVAGREGDQAHALAEAVDHVLDGVELVGLVLGDVGLLERGDDGLLQLELLLQLRVLRRLEHLADDVGEELDDALLGLGVLGLAELGDLVCVKRVPLISAMTFSESSSMRWRNISRL